MSNVLYQGIAIALASLNRMHDQPTMVCDVLRGFSITLDDLRQAGVERYDLDEIRKCLAQGGPGDRAQLGVGPYGRSPAMSAMRQLRRDNVTSGCSKKA